MTVIGFHNSHEQIAPAELLRAVQHAEEVGFTAAMCSDHLMPWNPRQNESGFAWAWLGAALATTSLPFGAVNAPGYRYHPVIIAQAIATLGSMFPGRFWVALGSGEAMNEHVTGEVWPRKEIRDQKLRECVDVIRSLLKGEEVSHEGLVTVDRAQLWTLPEVQPALIGPAVSVETARRHADWADGLVTINQPHDKLRDMIAAYRDAGGRGTLTIQVHVSWAPTEEEALATAHDQWRSNVFPPPLCWDLDTPVAFDLASAHVSPDDVREAVRVSADLGQHAAWVQEYVDLGFEQVYLHHVGQTQTAFLDAFGEKVLPQLGVTKPAPAVAVAA
ncbi:TIGR03885 family FMN-dependent LLM class oxidoreductase [Modestobacter sp. I12A-02628]|uniref:TIGR03885 family FMN-dependent LLM class oxidoreductase n=1 Tax=Goekera deserti TaxID=2497753 RepID=A0A7K3WHA1_9ACTN|nr:TIGR03885 family FMN-dependent LLM class oxidoreductase [Goekera deserti]MPQ99017.1 TIGR03885 family FMN-dependent LLM class oxidoreductase [Goekera deserti]NDI47351.1 TIGR03885 family FMN-dependent LLM class oxidoreductase [Goekera deserti]NEL55881.1 TIGR03885 family FMN-dependent LLM class oxidoreductase [Goekera deserti]